MLDITEMFNQKMRENYHSQHYNHMVIFYRYEHVTFASE